MGKLYLLLTFAAVIGCVIGADNSESCKGILKDFIHGIRTYTMDFIITFTFLACYNCESKDGDRICIDKPTETCASDQCFYLFGSGLYMESSKNSNLINIL